MQFANQHPATPFSVLQAAREKIHSGHEDAFAVCNLPMLREQYLRWCKCFPRVEPFYALKCNSDSRVVQMLSELGCGFDCASRSEIDHVLECGLPSNSAANRIIYANPCKQRNHLLHAHGKDVRLMTFDNIDELYKVKEVCPNAEMVIRILPDDSSSVCRFGQKFGADLKVVPQLLKVAKDLEMNVVGVSFHVGSGNSDPAAFVDAVQLAHDTFEIGFKMGFDFTLLDIGGGFPGCSLKEVEAREMQNAEGAIFKTSFETISSEMKSVLDKLFPESKNPGLRIIGEPGRFMVRSVFTLVTNVIARRVVSHDQDPDRILNHQVQQSVAVAVQPSDLDEQHSPREIENDRVVVEVATTTMSSCFSSGSGSGSVPFSATTSESGINSSGVASSCSSEVTPTCISPPFPDVQPQQKTGYMYYINDGVYGSFNCILYDHAVVEPHFFNFFDIYCEKNTEQRDFGNQDKEITKFTSSVWGPTCDGLDCVCESVELPVCNVGDWLYFPNMGAYTTAAASRFNGFEKPQTIYIP